MVENRLADNFGPGFGFLDFLKTHGGQLRLISVGVVVAQVIEQDDAFLQAPDGAPQRVFHVFGKRGEQAVRRIRVPGMAAVANEVAVGDGRQDPVAFRTGKMRGLAQRQHAQPQGPVLRGDARFDSDFLLLFHGNFSDFGHRFGREPHQQGRQLGNGYPVVHGHGGQGIFGHRGYFGFGGFLHDGNATPAFDGPQAGRAVVQAAGQDHPDNPRAIDVGGGTKQRVDGGPKPVFFRPPGNPHEAILEQQVPVGRRYVNAVRGNYLVINGIGGQYGFLLVDDLRQDARDVRRHVPDDKNGGVQVAR